MARKTRRLFALQGSVAIGATDATPTLILGPDATASVALVTPLDNLTFLGAEIVQRAAGTGTGTFGLQFAYGSGNTIMSDASPTTLVDADAAAGTVHGFADTLSGGGGIPSGQQIKAISTKAGSVTGNATLAVILLFGIDAL